jgi:hypothetical protein
MEGSRQTEKEEDVTAGYQCAGYKGLQCNSTQSRYSKRGEEKLKLWVEEDV